MKKILMTLGACGLLMTGCVDLDQEPLSFPTPENIDKTPENVESMLNGLYTNLWYDNYGYNCRTVLMGLGADDIATGSLSKRHANIDALYVRAGEVATSQSGSNDSEYLWQNFYTVIQSANQWIEGIEGSVDLTEEEKAPYIAEARFFRAFAHFNLIRWFGDVPAFTNSLCTTDAWGNAVITRNPQEDIYNDVIIPDLQYAEAYLPDRDDANNRASGKNSRVNKWAAKACLIDVYMTMAGWPLHQTDKWALARDKAWEFIQQSPYELVDHYEDLWKEADKDDGTEHIFALNHSTVQNMASNYGRSYFLEEEGGWADYAGDSCFYEMYPDDERKEFNYVTDFVINRRPVNFRQLTMRSPAINKYRDYGGVSSAQSNGITPIYRYAQVLLMYAEAQNEADGAPNQDAFDCLNDVRRRAAIDKSAYQEITAADLTGNAQEQFRQLVFDENGWEFFAEFKRWFQLQRTERIYDVNHGYTDAFGVQREANPRVRESMDRFGIDRNNRQIYLMPLPSREVMDCGFTQNPSF